MNYVSPSSLSNVNARSVGRNACQARFEMIASSSPRTSSTEKRVLKIALEQFDRAVTEGLQETELTAARCAVIDAYAKCGNLQDAAKQYNSVIEVAGDSQHMVQHRWCVFSHVVRALVCHGDVLFGLQFLNKAAGQQSNCCQILEQTQTSNIHALQQQVQRSTVTLGDAYLGLDLRELKGDVHCTVLGFKVTPRASMSGSEHHNTAPSSAKIVTSSAKIEEFAVKKQIQCGDLVETINGIQVLNWKFPQIAKCLSDAGSKSVVTFIRGPNVEGLLEAFKDEERVGTQESTRVLRNYGLEIAVCATCNNTSCLASLTFKQIRAAWTDDPDEFATVCCHCNARTTAQITIHRTRSAGKRTVLASAGGKPSSSTSDSKEQFVCFSSAVLKKQLQHFQKQRGGALVTLETLLEDQPALYWNVVIVLLDLDCPLDFLHLGNTNARTEQPVHVAGSKCESPVSVLKPVDAENEMDKQSKFSPVPSMQPMTDFSPTEEQYSPAPGHVKLSENSEHAQPLPMGSLTIECVHRMEEMPQELKVEFVHPLTPKPERLGKKLQHEELESAVPGSACGAQQELEELKKAYETECLERSRLKQVVASMKGKSSWLCCICSSSGLLSHVA
jgi:hypothetical protein